MLKYKIPQIVTLTRYNANTCAFLSIKWSINEKTIRTLYNNSIKNKANW